MCEARGHKTPRILKIMERRECTLDEALDHADHLDSHRVIYRKWREIATKNGVSKHLFSMRLKRGDGFEKAATVPPRKWQPRKDKQDKAASGGSA